MRAFGWPQMDLKSVRRLAVTTSVLALACAACAIGSSPSGGSTPVKTVVTFEVVDERYRIELVDPTEIEIARRLLRGQEAPAIPSGLVVRGDPGVNTGYSWHIDPESLEFADLTTEVCDGRPSDVEANRITSDRFCPWTAKVVEITE